MSNFDITILMVGGAMSLIGIVVLLIDYYQEKKKKEQPVKGKYANYTARHCR